MYIMCLFIFEEKVEILDQNTLSLIPDQKVDDPILGIRIKVEILGQWHMFSMWFFCMIMNRVLQLPQESHWLIPRAHRMDNQVLLSLIDGTHSDLIHIVNVHKTIYLIKHMQHYVLLTIALHRAVEKKDRFLPHFVHFSKMQILNLANTNLFLHS